MFKSLILNMSNSFSKIIFSFFNLIKFSKCTSYFNFSLIMRMIHGASDGVVLLVTLHGLGSLFDKGKIGGNMGIWGISQVAGSLFGMMIYPKIGHLYGYQYSFIISGVSLVVTAVLIAVFAHIKNIKEKRLA